ncbi:MAG: ParA family protein [Planctomycetota bacterium]|nr:MAG: ParA family protein [Planctomycetota bacterium]
MKELSQPASPRAEVLALFNQKGGCGKTTTAVNLAGALAARGERALLVDLDPQAHATMALGHDGEVGPTLAEVLIDDAPTASAIVSAPGDVALLPSGSRLAEFEEIAERTIGPERILAARLDQVAASYDWILVDCPPRADGVLCANALWASNVALLVVETGAFALQGAVKALGILAEVGEQQGRAFDVRAVGTLFDRRLRFARELLIAIQARFGAAMFDTVIRSSVRLREAPAMGVPVQVLDPTCRAASDFASLAAEIVAARPSFGAQAQSGSRAAAASDVPRLAELLREPS